MSALKKEKKNRKENKRNAPMLFFFPLPEEIKALFAKKRAPAVSEGREEALLCIVARVDLAPRRQWPRAHCVSDAARTVNRLTPSRICARGIHVYRIVPCIARAAWITS